MDEITLRTGEMFPVLFAGAAGNELFIEITDTDFMTAANIFSNPEKTARIIYQDRVFEGYRMCAIIIESGGIRINLTR